jgi:hypothetical protein
VTRELGRSYLYLQGSAPTYLFRTEGSEFGPSFALRLSLGFGYRL